MSTVIRVFEMREQTTQYLGCDLGCVHGKLEWRVILDVKGSEVTASTRKTHSVVLPRITDAVTDALEMMSQLQPNGMEDIERLVLDFVDALWNVPLRHSERRFFTGKIIDTVYHGKC